MRMSLFLCKGTNSDEKPWGEILWNNSKGGEWRQELSSGTQEETEELFSGEYPPLGSVQFARKSLGLREDMLSLKDLGRQRKKDGREGTVCGEEAPVRAAESWQRQERKAQEKVGSSKLVNKYYLIS